MAVKKIKQCDKERLYDGYYAEESLSSAYQDTILIASSSTLHSELVQLLTEQLQIVFDLTSELSKRGFLKIKTVDKVQMSQLKQHYLTDLLDG